MVGQAVELVQRRELLRRKMRTKMTENPAREQFTLLLPPDLPEVDLNAMKLAAQFTAKNGMEFERGLMQREHRNPMVIF